jgi:hypothetical protein
MSFGNFSLPLVTAYLAYCVCGLFIRIHSLSFHEALSSYGRFLVCVIALFYVFDVGFLLYLIFHNAWYVPIVLFVAGLVMNLGLHVILERSRVTVGLVALALAWSGIFLCPILGYALIRSA